MSNSKVARSKSTKTIGKIPPPRNKREVELSQHGFEAGVRAAEQRALANVRANVTPPTTPVPANGQPTHPGPVGPGESLGQSDTPFLMLQRCGSGLLEMISTMRNFALTGWTYHASRDVRDAVLSDYQKVFAEADNNATDVEYVAGACAKYFEKHPEDAQGFNDIIRAFDKGPYAGGPES